MPSWLELQSKPNLEMCFFFNYSLDWMKRHLCPRTHASKHSFQVDVSKELVVTLVGLGQPASARSAEVLLNTAGALGCVGSLPSTAEHNFIIGSALLDITRAAVEEAAKQPAPARDAQTGKQAALALETAAEALNSLVDVYTEDNVHTAAIKQLKLLQSLAPCVERLAVLLRRFGPGLEPGLAQRVDEVVENAAAFLDYKKDHC